MSLLEMMKERLFLDFQIVQKLWWVYLIAFGLAIVVIFWREIMK